MPRAPKPSGLRHGHSPVEIEKVPVNGDAVVWPPPDPGWCDIAARWYTAHQAEDAPYRSSTDVASLFMWATVIDRAFRSPRLSGQLLAVVRGAEAAHGCTEGDRRRLHIELTRAEKEVPHSVLQLASYRRSLGGA